MLYRRRITESEPHLKRDVAREWQLPCDDCDHVGEIRATLIELHRWIAHGRLRCAECGSIKQRGRGL
jgi:hypothetical protein